VSAKKGLGRGFDSLIPTELLDESFDPTAEQDERVSDLRYIKLASIMPDPDQPRREFDDDALVELSKSIKEHGVLQPVVLQRVTLIISLLLKKHLIIQDKRINDVKENIAL